MDKAIVLETTDRISAYLFLREYLQWHRGERTTPPHAAQPHITALEEIVRQTKDP